MPKHHKPRRDKILKRSLLQWGASCILGGVISGNVMSSLPANNRPEFLARMAGALLIIVVGVVLVVVHFIRRGRS